MKWKLWSPFFVAVIIAVIINLYPIVMAFVFKVEGWAQTGWVFYFFTIPIGAVLLLLGLAVSLLLIYLRNRKQKQN